MKKMGDARHHALLAAEKRLGALDEYRKHRYTNVGDLALKAVEQAIEAAAAKDGHHFHLHPRSAHADRNHWAKTSFPRIAIMLDVLWSAYGDLGYDGLDGKRAAEAVKAMEAVLDEIGKRTGIRFREID